MMRERSNVCPALVGGAVKPQCWSFCNALHCCYMLLLAQLAVHLAWELYGSAFFFFFFKKRRGSKKMNNTREVFALKNSVGGNRISSMLLL